MFVLVENYQMTLCSRWLDIRFAPSNSMLLGSQKIKSWTATNVLVRIKPNRPFHLKDSELHAHTLICLFYEAEKTHVHLMTR